MTPTTKKTHTTTKKPPETFPSLDYIYKCRECTLGLIVIKIPKISVGGAVSIFYTVCPLSFTLLLKSQIRAISNLSTVCRNLGTLKTNVVDIKLKNVKIETDPTSRENTESRTEILSLNTKKHHKNNKMSKIKSLTLSAGKL